MPQVLLPLLHLSTKAPARLQHTLVLNLSLWLRHASEGRNQAMLSQQLGWQLPICTILNGVAGDPDAERASASRALCVRPLSEHLMSMYAIASVHVYCIHTHVQVRAAPLGAHHRVDSAAWR